MPRGSDALQSRNRESESFMSDCESLPCCQAVAKALTGAGLERQTADRFGFVELDTQERPVARPAKATATKPAATAMAPVRAKRRSADVDLARLLRPQPSPGRPVLTQPRLRR